MSIITIHTDGASRGNPGAASIAYIIEGIEPGPISFYQAIGQFSNNQAEYRALLAALTKLTELSIKDQTINFLADSELMIKQINGQYRVKDSGLLPLFTEVKALIKQLELSGNQLFFTAVRREQNQQADKLANKALDEAK